MTVDDIYSYAGCSDGKIELEIESFDIALRKMHTSERKHCRVRVDDPNLCGSIAAFLYPHNDLNTQTLKFWCGNSFIRIPSVLDIKSLQPCCEVMYCTNDV